jgi:hypothetical protein
VASQPHVMTSRAAGKPQETHNLCSGMEGRESENGNLFSPPTMEWAYQHDDALQMVGIELKEARPDLGAEL